MQVSQAIAVWFEYHESNSRESTLKAYMAVLSNFSRDFRVRNLTEVTPKEIVAFLNRMTEGTKPQTKHARYSHLSTFFNFIRNNVDQDFRDPCDTPMMRRSFRNRSLVQWNNIEKDTVDEIIFKTEKIRNRLMLELIARGGMRMGRF
jgi:integrase/recombinase XerD